MTEKGGPESLFNNRWVEPDTSFRPLMLRRKKGVVQPGNIYRVYHSREEYVSILADSVIHAMRKSGIDEPVRVVKIGTMHYNVFNDKGLRVKQAMQERVEGELAQKQPTQHKDSNAFPAPDNHSTAIEIEQPQTKGTD